MTALRRPSRVLALAGAGCALAAACTSSPSASLDDTGDQGDTGGSVASNSPATTSVPPSVPKPSPSTSPSPSLSPSRPGTVTASPAALAACPTVPAAGPVAGRGLPDLTLSCLGPGRSVRLADLRGPATLTIWAGWCQPCQREAPVLQGAASRAAGRVAVLGVLSDDTTADGRAASRGLGMTYPSLADPTGRLRRALGLTGPPVTLFVDGSGRLVHVQPGGFASLAQYVDSTRRYLGVSW